MLLSIHNSNWYSEFWKLYQTAGKAVVIVRLIVKASLPLVISSNGDKHFSRWQGDTLWLYRNNFLCFQKSLKRLSALRRIISLFLFSLCRRAFQYIQNLVLNLQYSTLVEARFFHFLPSNFKCLALHGKYCGCCRPINRQILLFHFSYFNNMYFHF